MPHGAIWPGRFCALNIRSAWPSQMIARQTCTVNRDAEASKWRAFRQCALRRGYPLARFPLSPLTTAVAPRASDLLPSCIGLRCGMLELLAFAVFCK